MSSSSILTRRSPRLVFKAKQKTQSEKLSTADMLKNFAKEGGAIAKGGFKMVSSEDKKARLDLCGACEHHKGKGIQMRCLKCGCFMKIKAGFAEAKCPVGKW